MPRTLVAFALIATACGSHVESGRAVDGAAGPAAGRASEEALAALERDPASVISAAKHPTYKATYEMRIVSPFPAGSGSGPMDRVSSETFAVRPPDFRVEYTSKDTTPSHVIGVVRGQNAYLCLDTPAPPACYTVPTEQAQVALAGLNASPLEQLKSVTKDADVEVLPRENIAGRDAACFRWRLNAPSPSPSPFLDAMKEVRLEACFSAEGIMLRMLTGAFFLFVNQRATSVTDTVSDADFALPYPLNSGPIPIPLQTAPALPTARPTPTR